ncbi:MAG: hypothetical protein H6836_03630 [Planctomycetes bacterium]|nr:hypothetical protein [Planctomycetota bacterium]MCB9872492.1 hypothetical protein [Planctomycetota bacterium]MCB9888643.1 hypothetical protein [Planctomycetota bacterium]
MNQPTRLLVVLSLLTLAGSAAAQRFRVMTANLWYSGTRGFDYVHGIYPLGQQITWPGFKGFAKQRFAFGYGVVGLQEIDRGTKRTGGLDVAADLAKALGPTWTHRFAATQESDGGHTGNAMLTNAGIAKLQYWSFAHNPEHPEDYGPRPRGAIAAKLDFAGKRLWFVTTHLEPANRFALAQVFQLLGRVKTFDPDTPVIVVGDMNILNGTGKSATEATYYAMAAAFGAAGFTDVSEKLPTRVPGAEQTIAVTDGQLDYVFLYDPHKRLELKYRASVWVMNYPNIFSDHLAVVADFEWL